MNAETGGRLTADEREALSNAIGAKIDQQFDEGEKIDIDWAIIYAADAAEAFFAARLADRDAALAEARETIVTLRDGYREAVGVPPSEHQSRRLEAMATRIEELMVENASLRAALHPAPSEAP
jgi:hypothetical protein